MKAVVPFRCVLVGFDGSADAAEALWVAGAVADAPGDPGQLVILCVISRALPPQGNGEGSDGVRPGTLVQTRVELVYSGGDSPGNVMTLYAQDHGFDILVLGRHGGGGRRKITLGRAADRAVRGCLVPVLLVSAPNGETPTIAGL